MTVILLFVPIRMPADSGGNNRVHFSFFQITVGILPEEPDNHVSGEKLSVMRMTGKIGIYSAIVRFF
ncbi:hypothetical protein [Massiliimalia massiliensis]|jgi:hypothetical protein|uniref:hypothetical protein n=1 Tax=Massiliimalia massiliensis TaxID=1852384 RepID=UPI000984914E|nr:hypothetical protein [Massiliimalia massiliensis]